MNEWIFKLRSEKYKNLAYILLLISTGQFFLVVFGVKVIVQEINLVHETLIRISTILMFILNGCAGFMMMIRREFPQVVFIRGRAAQIMGFGFWIISWFLALYFLVFTISVTVNSFVAIG